MVERHPVIETDPGLELRHEGQITHLRRVALDHMPGNCVLTAAVSDQQASDALMGARCLQACQVIRGNGPAIIVGARALAPDDGIGKRIGRRLPAL
jgi:hypothetical protein